MSSVNANSIVIGDTLLVQGGTVRFTRPSTPLANEPLACTVLSVDTVPYGRFKLIFPIAQSVALSNR